MRKALKYSGIAAIAGMMLSALAILFAPCLGWQIDTVTSGSMSPAVKVGSVVVTRPIDTRTIELGDIITYYSPQNVQLTTHRVVGIEEDSPPYFLTKGDANEEPDPYMVSSASIKGKVAFSMPLLGYITDFIKTPLGFCLILGLPGLIIIGLQVRNMWRGVSRGKVRVEAKVISDAGHTK